MTTTKSAFAKMINVSRGRISHYIRDKQLDGPAIVGQGHRARIDVEVALKQLRLRLDSTQMAGLNGLSTRLYPAAPVARSPARNWLGDEMAILETAMRRGAKAIAHSGLLTEKEAYDGLADGFTKFLTWMPVGG